MKVASGAISPPEGLKPDTPREGPCPHAVLDFDLTEANRNQTDPRRKVLARPGFEARKENSNVTRNVMLVDFFSFEPA